MEFNDLFGEQVPVDGKVFYFTETDKNDDGTPKKLEVSIDSMDQFLVNLVLLGHIKDIPMIRYETPSEKVSE